MANKNYTAALSKIDRDTNYTPEEAVKLLKEIATAKFDETVELHLRLNIDPRHADQQVRNTVLLPNGLGKKVRVLVFAEGEDARVAENAGVDYVADEDIFNKIANDGWTEFDVALATPNMMRNVGRLGRVLGRKGLMPTPKAGTVVQGEDLPRAIEEARAGRIEYRNDKTGNVHIPIGKISFDEEKLIGNMAAVLDSLIRNRPTGAKGRLIRRAVLASTMSPGIRMDISAAEAMVAV